MKARSSCVALVTAPDLKTARTIVKAALEARLAACANLIPKIESHFWWQGKLQRGKEVLIVFKTTSGKVGALERSVINSHPYETPEFIALEIARGNQRYLDWIGESVKEAAKRT